MAAYFKLWVMSSMLVLASSEPQDKSSPSFERKIRQAATPTIDLSSMPTCVQEQCVDSDVYPIDCPTIPAPCPPDTDSTTCVTYSQDCYCKQTTPLECAWPCNWGDWFLAEDWFARVDVCASAPNITFDALPSCAKECIQQNSFDYGCITHTKNCFCTHASLYGCDKGCVATADSGQGGKIATWYAQQCDVTIDEANGALTNSSLARKGTVQWTNLKGHKLRWYEIMAVTVAAATSITLVAVWAVLHFEKAAKKRNRARKTKGTTKNHSSKVVPEKISGDLGGAKEGPKNLKGRIRKLNEELKSRIEDVITDEPEEIPQTATPTDGDKKGL